MQKHGGIWLALLLALLAAAVLAPVAAMAEGTWDVEIDENNFPDAKFRDYVQSELASGRNFLTKDEIASVTTIDVCVQDISDLTGIEHFTALEELDCSYNNLTSLDVSQNTELGSLDCSPQTARLGVNRSADGTWSANLAALIGLNVSNVQTSTSGATAQGTTVTWSVGVQHTVTYDYNTGYNAHVR